MNTRMTEWNVAYCRDTCQKSVLLWLMRNLSWELCRRLELSNWPHQPSTTTVSTVPKLAPKKEFNRDTRTLAAVSTASDYQKRFVTVVIRQKCNKKYQSRVGSISKLFHVHKHECCNSFLSHSFWHVKFMSLNGLRVQIRNCCRISHAVRCHFSFPISVSVFWLASVYTFELDNRTWQHPCSASLQWPVVPSTPHDAAKLNAYNNKRTLTKRDGAKIYVALILWEKAQCFRCLLILTKRHQRSVFDIFDWSYLRSKGNIVS